MKKGELWILELPFTNGREQEGKRPGLVVSDTKTGIIVIVPLTSNLQALRFPYTLEIKKSSQNGLEKDSIALIFHIRSIDEKRFINKIGALEDFYLSQVDKVLKKLFQL